MDELHKVKCIVNTIKRQIILNMAETEKDIKYGEDTPETIDIPVPHYQF